MSCPGTIRGGLVLLVVSQITLIAIISLGTDVSKLELDFIGESSECENESVSITASQLLDEVLFRLPREPLVITGELIVRRRKGIVIKKVNFELLVRWGDNPVFASYTIRDTVGDTLEQLFITRELNNPPRYSYARGNPLVHAEMPGLFNKIQDSDITWADLTLSFLWWRNASIVGKETVKGYSCYIVDVVPPDSINVAGTNTSAALPYASVRLWIEKKNRVLLQAEGRASDGTPIRTMWVKSVKKINDRWMIKDMDVESHPSIHRTRLHIEDVQPANDTTNMPVKVDDGDTGGRK